jgi:hypothetical protein
MKIWDGCADGNFFKLNVRFIFPASIPAADVRLILTALLLLILLDLLLAYCFDTLYLSTTNSSWLFWFSFLTGRGWKPLAQNGVISQQR